MKVLVTGGLGHIGSALLRSWVVDEWTVLDDLSTQRYPSLWARPAITAPLRLVEADLVEADLPALVTGHDVVVHLAALTDAAGSIGRSEEYHRVNAEGTNRLAQACLDETVPLIFPSTTSVYGPQTGMVDETLPHVQYQPQSPYAESKLAAEHVLNAWFRPRGLRYTILRFGTIYGPSPGMRFHTFVNKACWQAAHAQPITVWSGAMDSRRAYCALGDALFAIRWAAGQLAAAGTTSSTYNVLTGNHTVRDVVTRLQRCVPEVELRETAAPLLNQQGYCVVSHTGRWPSSEDGAAERLQRGIERTLRLLRPELFGWQPRISSPRRAVHMARNSSIPGPIAGTGSAGTGPTNIARPEGNLGVKAPTGGSATVGQGHPSHRVWDAEESVATFVENVTTSRFSAPINADGEAEGQRVGLYGAPIPGGD